MRLLIDMDAVTVDIMPYWLDLYNEEFNDTLRPWQITDFDLSRFAAHGKAIYQYLHRPGFFRRPEPIPGALETIDKLKLDGHEIVFLTTCQAGHTDKIGWLQDRFDWVSYKDVVFSFQKHLVQGDVLLDDAPHNLNHPTAINVCFSQPWNANFTGDGFRVDTWSDFYDLIGSFTTQTEPRKNLTGF